MITFVNNVLRKPKLYILCVCSLIFLCCSSNPKLVAIDANEILHIYVIPSLPKDLIQTYYNKKIDGEIYKEYKPTIDEENSIQNKLVLYYTDDQATIRAFIKELQRETPSLFSVLGASYGVPTFRLEIYDKHSNYRKLNIIPTAGIRNTFYKYKNNLDYSVMQKYYLYTREQGFNLINDLKASTITWYIKEDDKALHENSRLYEYLVLLEFNTSESYLETQKSINRFMASIKKEIGKRVYSVDKQYSSIGFPISVHIYLKSKKEIDFVRSRALKSKCKFFYKPEPIEIYFPIKVNSSIAKVVEKYYLEIAK